MADPRHDAQAEELRSCEAVMMRNVGVETSQRFLVLFKPALKPRSSVLRSTDGQTLQGDSTSCCVVLAKGDTPLSGRQARIDAAHAKADELLRQGCAGETSAL